jgi:hypothetical protein
MNPDRADDLEGVGELRAFLLGTLPDADAERVELSLLSDDALYESLLATEEELIDEYLCGALSLEEASSFLGYLNRLPDGRARIDLAKDLGRTLRSNRLPSSVWRGRLEAMSAGASRLRRWRLPAWAAAAGIAGAVFAISLSVGMRDAAPLLLNAGSTRGGGALPTASLSRLEGSVRMMLEIGFSAHHRYRATLLDVESRPIRSLADLEATSTVERLFVAFSIPTEGLEPGDYSVTLDGETASGGFEPLGRYVFRLTE